MRLVTFTPRPHGPQHVGLVRDANSIIDVKNAGGNPPFDPADMLSVIAAGEPARDWLRNLGSNAGQAIPLTAVTLLAPIPRPRKNVFCVGWNYVEHFAEGAKTRPHVQEMPAHPAFFTKAPTTVNGPFADVPAHRGVTEKLDWEVELAVIIGTAGINISEANAFKHVFGYTVVNDVSAREVQRQHGQQWFKGKSLDGHLPMGPWIATADEVQDPQDLHITCRVNGVVKQDSSTRHMVLQDSTYHRRAVRRIDARTRRHYLHGHTSRRRTCPHAARVHETGRHTRNRSHRPRCSAQHNNCLTQRRS